MEGNVGLSETAESLMQAERWAEAIALIQSESSYLDNSDLSWSLGWAYFKLGDYDAAELHLTRATQLTPTRAAAWWALGTAQRKNGLLAEAERNLKHSLSLKDSSNARSALALTLMHRGKIAEAEQVHLMGLELKPESAERWKSYACFLDDLGRLQEADMAYRKARYFEGA